MLLNTTDAMPYIYAAGVQAITAGFNHFASTHTKAYCDKILAEKTKYYPVEGGGHVPEGTPIGTLIDERLAPDAVLKYASRDRDLASIATSVLLIVAPILFTGNTSRTSAQIKVLVLAVTVAVVVSAFVLIRRWLTRSERNPPAFATHLAVIGALLFNGAAAIYFLFQPVSCIPVTPPP